MFTRWFTTGSLFHVPEAAADATPCQQEGTDAMGTDCEWFGEQPHSHMVVHDGYILLVNHL